MKHIGIIISLLCITGTVFSQKISIRFDSLGQLIKEDTIVMNFMDSVGSALNTNQLSITVEYLQCLDIENKERHIKTLTSLVEELVEISNDTFLSVRFEVLYPCLKNINNRNRSLFPARVGLTFGINHERQFREARGMIWEARKNDYYDLFFDPKGKLDVVLVKNKSSAIRAFWVDNYEWLVEDDRSVLRCLQLLIKI